MAIEPLMEEFQSVQGSYRGQCGLKLDGDAMCWNTTDLTQTWTKMALMSWWIDDDDATVGASTNGPCP